MGEETCLGSYRTIGHSQWANKWDEGTFMQMGHAWDVCRVVREKKKKKGQRWAWLGPISWPAIGP